MLNRTAIEKLTNGVFDDRLNEIYMCAGETCELDRQRTRYIEAIKEFEGLFGSGEITIFSAPGRTEICGNHTDHQHGEVLAASINLDAIAVARITSDNLIRVKSGDYAIISIPADNLTVQSGEEGTTAALIRGTASALKDKGYNVGGFCAYITSNVLIGAGLSSSAAFESVIGTIISGLYNDMKIPAEEIAKAGQIAENKFFGKPCGLMDQMACSVGSLVHIDFKDPAAPVINKVDLDLTEFGYTLVITDTKGSHSDLTPEYAAVPEEMHLVAAVFGKDFLRDVDEELFMSSITQIREHAGDRAVLRALHFYEENRRVQKAVDSISNGDFESFLEAVNDSGNSSFKYLQNVYTNKDISHQNVSVALALSDWILGCRGACRVHGGGFAGTIQAFVPDDIISLYITTMDSVFGEGSAKVLKIRKYGGIMVL